MHHFNVIIHELTLYHRCTHVASYFSRLHKWKTLRCSSLHQPHSVKVTHIVDKCNIFLKTLEPFFPPKLSIWMDMQKVIIY